MPSGQDGVSFTDRYFLDRMQLATLDIAFSETDEISTYLRAQSKKCSGLDKHLKAISEPPNTPMMAEPIMDYDYCPIWFSRLQFSPSQYNSSSLMLFRAAVMHIRYLGERTGFCEGSCKVDKLKDKGRIINRICLNYSGLERVRLLNEFVEAQEYGRSLAKMEFGYIELPACRFGLDSWFWLGQRPHQDGNEAHGLVETGSEEWLNSLTFQF